MSFTFTKINGFNINLSILRGIHNRNYLKAFISLLTHERIHSKIFKRLGVKKTKISIRYVLSNGAFYFYGSCRPLGQIKYSKFFIIDFVHFIYDIIYDVLDTNFIQIPNHFMGFFNDMKQNVKKMKELIN